MRVLLLAVARSLCWRAVKRVVIVVAVAVGAEVGAEGKGAAQGREGLWRRKVGFHGWGGGGVALESGTLS